MVGSKGTSVNYSHGKQPGSHPNPLTPLRAHQSHTHTHTCHPPQPVNSQPVGNTVHQALNLIICTSHCAVMTPWNLINATIDFIVKREIRCMDSISIHQNALAYKLSVYVL